MPLPLTSQSFDHEDYSTAPPELEPPFDDGPLPMPTQIKKGAWQEATATFISYSIASPAEQSDSSSPHFPNFILQETKQQGVGKKCLQTEVQEQVDMLNDDPESMHSEKLALYQLKNKCLMVKLNANCQDKEHHLLCEEHTHECVDAVLVHQWLLENKAQEIHLWEADAKALKLEMEVMLLHIEYTKLKKQ
ncbi:hypothetical protein BDR07DRAFT_1382241 [Suillus spraguei]|nr:hypothetical protein BDR07DRAFT_1382241 [Suillus spraguei]